MLLISIFFIGELLMNNCQKVYIEIAYLINKKLYESKIISYNAYRYAEDNLNTKIRK